MRMKIPFGEIGREKTRYEIRDDSWFRLAEVVDAVSHANAEITVQRISEDRVAVNGRLVCTIDLVCDRCGDPVKYALDEDFFYLVTTREEDEPEQPEKECSKEESTTLYLNEPVIDVMEMLREQMVLAIPGKVLCDEMCRGVCPRCGGSLNRGECTCTEPLPDSPFAVLQKLKNKD